MQYSLVHLCHVGRHILRQHAPTIGQLDVSSALQGSQEGGHVGSQIFGGLFNGVVELQMGKAVWMLHEGIWRLAEWQAGRGGLLSVSHEESVIGVPRDRRMQQVGPDQGQVLDLDQHVQMEVSSQLKLKPVKVGVGGLLLVVEDVLTPLVAVCTWRSAQGRGQREGFPTEVGLWALGSGPLGFLG